MDARRKFGELERSVSFLSTNTILIEHRCVASLGLIDTVMYTLCTGTTLGSLAVISRDRYLAVTKPFWYRNHVTKSCLVCLDNQCCVKLILGHVFFSG